MPTKTRECKLSLTDVADDITKIIRKLDQHNAMLSEDEVFLLEAYASDIRELGRVKDVEIANLRKLVRCETVQPPADVTDDQTTELAVELATERQRVEQVTQQLTRMGELYQSACQMSEIRRKETRTLRHDIDTLQRRVNYLTDIAKRQRRRKGKNEE